MKMKVTISITFVLALSVGVASAAPFSLVPYIAKAIISGGFDGADENGGRAKGSGGPTLDELKNSIRSGAKGGDGAAQPVIGENMTGAGQSDQMTEDFFNNRDQQSQIALQQVFDTAGYITPSFEGAGQVVDGSNRRQMAYGLLSNIYIDKGERDGARVGDKFWVLHPYEKVVSHPQTGDRVGIKIIIDGAVEIVEIADKTSKAKIFRSFDGIKRGYKIVPYDNKKVPSIDPDKRIIQKDIAGYLISGRLENMAFAQGDVVYFDVGTSAGVEPGDLFDIIDLDMVKLADGSPEPGLPKLKGKARIITTREVTSAALIVTSQNSINIGDKVRFAEQK